MRAKSYYEKSEWRKGRPREVLKSDSITQPRDNGEFMILQKIGSGAFGVIWSVQMSDGRRLSLKKVLQDPRYKNRELGMIQQLDHVNCIKLIDYKQVRENGKMYLELFTELFPTDLHNYLSRMKYIPLDLVKIFGYQLFNGLSYLHFNGITHRDIKSANILIDPEKGRLQICDFGSAKRLLPDERSVSYISTRCYRAPELLYAAEIYTSQIDVWAAACVLCEMFNNGKELFPAISNDDLISIICNIIGSPTKDDYLDMNANKTTIIDKPCIPLTLSLAHPLDPLFYDLLQKIFVYSPSKRITAQDAKNHPFFNGVKEGRFYLPNGKRFVID